MRCDQQQWREANALLMKRRARAHQPMGGVAASSGHGGLARTGKIKAGSSAKSAAIIASAQLRSHTHAVG